MPVGYDQHLNLRPEPRRATRAKDVRPGTRGIWTPRYDDSAQEPCQRIGERSRAERELNAAQASRSAARSAWWPPATPARRSARSPGGPPPRSTAASKKAETRCERATASAIGGLHHAPVLGGVTQAQGETIAALFDGDKTLFELLDERPGHWALAASGPERFTDSCGREWQWKLRQARNTCERFFERLEEDARTRAHDSSKASR